MAILTRRLLASWIAALLFAGSTTAWGAGQVAGEYELKAAFLYNFARFVDWPVGAYETATSPIVIGVLGDDPFGKSLDDIVAGETVRGRKLVIVRGRTLEAVGDCHILFVSTSHAEESGRLAAALKPRSVLTVGEGARFAEEGGIVAFETAGGHVRLRINLAASRAAHVTISSQLLRQAKIVGPEKLR